MTSDESVAKDARPRTLRRPARVPGAAQAPIRNDALAAVLNWVLLEFNRETLPAGFRPLRGSEVGRSRVQALADPLK